MIRFGLEIVAPAGKREEIETILRSLVGPTNVLEGCISCRVSQDIEQPEILRLDEEWKTEELLGGHLRSDEFRKVLAVMDLSGKPPRIRFELPSGEKGMEYLADVRSAAGT